MRTLKRITALALAVLLLPLHLYAAEDSVFMEERACQCAFS